MLKFKIFKTTIITVYTQFACFSFAFFSDTVRLCSLEYIDGECRQETHSTGKSSRTTKHACACNEDLCNGAVTSVSALSLTFSMCLCIYFLSKVIM